MTSQESAFAEFAAFAARLKGDEKSEAQTFVFHLLEAFGHDANTRLNLQCATREADGQQITRPGLPGCVPDPESYVSRDCVRVESGPLANGSTAQSYAEAAHFHTVKEEPTQPE
jgi:hypothetical protein